MQEILNVYAFLYSFYVFFFRKRLAIPCLMVDSINDISVKELRRSQIKAVIFDKDNTLTSPYAESVHRKISKHLKVLATNFRVVILSNSAGSLYDWKGKAASIIEKQSGIKVLRHRLKKPARVKNIESVLGCKKAEIAMVGDRVLTDIVFGNRNGMLTILVNPLAKAGLVSRNISRLERLLVRRWMKKSVNPN